MRAQNRRRGDCRDCVGTGRGDLLDAEAKCQACGGTGQALLSRYAALVRASQHREPGRGGVVHLIDCRLAPRYAMSSGECSATCVEARDLLEARG